MVASHTITPVILCGGAGSRLWPMSRDSKPKQFHKLVNDKTLLTNTLERVDHRGEGLRYLPTLGNFISLNVEQDGMALYRKLLEQGVIVRPVANYSMPEYLRITIGTQQQNERFVETLRQCL